MKYLPWDRLQLDSAIDGGWRVSKPDILFSTFRTYRRKLYWTPMFQKNGAIFHDGDLEQKLTFIKTLAEQSRKFPESATVTLFDLNGSHKKMGEELEELSLGFEYHPYEDSFEQLLEDLYSLRKEIRKNNSGSGHLEPPNRKVLVVIIDMDERIVAETEVSLRSRELLRDLLVDSQKDRLHLIPMASKAESIPGEIMRALDWAVYLGDDNRNFARNFYKNLDEGYYSFGQVHIGSHYSVHEKRIAAVHPLKFTPSEWYLAQRKQLQEDDEAYEVFLETLDDGSENFTS